MRDRFTIAVSSILVRPNPVRDDSMFLISVESLVIRISSILTVNCPRAAIKSDRVWF